MGTLAHFCITAFAKIISTGSFIHFRQSLKSFLLKFSGKLCNMCHREIVCIKNWPNVSHDHLMRFNMQMLVLTLEEPGKASFISYFNFST